jgi:hypothetical protein
MGHPLGAAVTLRLDAISVTLLPITFRGVQVLAGEKRKATFSSQW